MVADVGTRHIRAQAREGAAADVATIMFEGKWTFRRNISPRKAANNEFL